MFIADSPNKPPAPFGRAATRSGLASHGYRSSERSSIGEVATAINIALLTE